MLILGDLFKTQSDKKNIHQNALNCTIFSKCFAGSIYAPEPLNPISDPGYFRQQTIRSRKLLCQSSPYHKCVFHQVFQACFNWNFSKIRDFNHFTAISK